MTTPTELLRDAQLRVTRPRVTVLEVLRDHPHASADAVAQQVRAAIGTVSTQAVYDVLHALENASLIRRFEPAGSSARYELQAHDNHHHLVCRRCGTITDVECGTGIRPCMDAPDDHGFAVDETEVIYWGLCPECKSLDP